MKKLNKIYRLIILHIRFQNVGTVVVKLFKGSKKIEFKKRVLNYGPWRKMDF